MAVRAVAYMEPPWSTRMKKENKDLVLLVHITAVSCLSVGAAAAYFFGAAAVCIIVEYIIMAAALSWLKYD